MRTALLLTALLLVSALMVVTPVSANAIADFSLNIPGEDQQFGDEGRVLMVAGVFHEITIILDNPASNLDLVLAPQNANASTLADMLFRVNHDGSTWGSDTHQVGVFIDIGNSSVSGNTYVLRTGLASSVVKGDWNISVSADGELLGTYDIQVQEMRIGVSHSTPPFTFHVEPYNQTVETETSGDYFRVENSGNVPLVTTIAFSPARLNPNLDVTDVPPIYHLGETHQHHVNFTSGFMTPGINRWTGSILFTPTFILTSEAVSLTHQIAVDIDGTISAARPGFQVTSAGDGDLVMQYRPSHILPYEQDLKLILYMTGRHTALLEMDSPDFDVLSVEIGTRNKSLPQEVDLTEDVELEVTIELRPREAARVTEIYLNLTTLDGLYHASGKIIVAIQDEILKPPPVAEGVEEDNEWLLVIFVVIAFAIIVLAIATLSWVDKRSRRGK